MKDEFKCPCCGADITQIVQCAFFAQRSDAGKARTAKKTAAQRSNMAKLNAAYTPEKRKAAAEKRRATLAAKKRQEKE